MLEQLCYTFLHVLNVSRRQKRLKAFQTAITFAKKCFINKNICDAHHLELYDTWNCDLRPCEECMRNIQGEATTCSRFKVMLPFSDQESAYETFGHQISSVFEEYLAQDTPFEFPFHHMH